MTNSLYAHSYWWPCSFCEQRGMHVNKHHGSDTSLCGRRSSYQVRAITACLIALRAQNEKIWSKSRKYYRITLFIIFHVLSLIIVDHQNCTIHSCALLLHLTHSFTHSHPQSAVSRWPNRCVYRCGVHSVHWWTLRPHNMALHNNTQRYSERYHMGYVVNWICEQIDWLMNEWMNWWLNWWLSE